MQTCRPALLRIFRHTVRHRACSAMAHKYEDAIRALNGLQKNASIIDELRKDAEKAKCTRGGRNKYSLPEFTCHLNRVGIKVEELDQLSVIHVSGTKGKVSRESSRRYLYVSFRDPRVLSPRVFLGIPAIRLVFTHLHILWKSEREFASMGSHSLGRLSPDTSGIATECLKRAKAKVA
eukprot:m.240155 g.240155  ORF g.240155 m.240155 type:complete len:178 (+) comp40193_c0_seq21:11-544(+)